MIGLSVRKIKENIESLLESKVHDILPSVYEYRYVKVIASDGDLDYTYWTYLGIRSDYLIVPLYFCSCKDFIIRTVINKTAPCCKHILGVHLAMKKGRYTVVRASVQDSDRIVSEIMSRSFSPTLRRLLYFGRERGIYNNESSPNKH